jgi:predicted PolB exonuclease-like 3'-5' exonuclease
MPASVIVWDIETVPDLRGFAAANGLTGKPDDEVRAEMDLCDVLSCFSPQNKPSLHELCRVLGLPGKPDGVGGADVERFCREGRAAEVAAYCETDVVNTYRVWLPYELFRGRLTENGLRASEASLSDYIRSHSGSKPHLAYLQVEEQHEAVGLDRPLGVQSESDGEIFIPDAPGV